MKQKQMVKRFFGAALLAIVLVCGLALAGCEETVTEDHAYNFGIYDFSATGNIFAIGTVENYLKSQGCIMGTKIYSGSSRTDCDAKAQADLNSSVAKISRSALNSQLSSVTVSFKYTCMGDGFTGNGFSY